MSHILIQIKDQVIRSSNMQIKADKSHSHLQVKHKFKF
jgi:hypothetical protein